MFKELKQNDKIVSTYRELQQQNGNREKNQMEILELKTIMIEIKDSPHELKKYIPQRSWGILVITLYVFLRSQKHCIENYLIK